MQQQHARLEDAKRMKHILVIGGSYFAGRVFVEHLADRSDCRVHVFNRGNIPLPISAVDQIVGDREQPEDIARRIPDLAWDAVVDFCAYTPGHVGGMLAGLKGAVGRYILISTTDVYTHGNGGPIGENAPLITAPQPELGQFADYGFNKLGAERALHDACREAGIPYAILRPAIIYGRYNYAPRESWFFDAITAGRPLPIPRHSSTRFSFVWVDDLARLIIRLIEAEKDACACYNVAAPEALGYTDLVGIFEKVCGRRSTIRRLSIPQIRHEQIALPFPPDVNLHYDGRCIADVFEFDYTPFVTGMRRTWEHYNRRVKPV